jgi:HlyD family secretion protein
MRGKGWLISGVAVIAIAGGLALRRKPAPPVATRAPAIAAPNTKNEFTLRGKIRAQHVIGVAATVPGFVEAFLAEPGEDVYEGQVLARIGAQSLDSVRESAANALERAQEQAGRSDAALNSARLELSRAEADAQRSQMSLDRVEKVHTRQEMLFRQGATPRLTYEKARADYEAALKDYEIMSAAVNAGRDHVNSVQKDVANARKMVEEKRGELEKAQENLASSEVRSPVDGFVVAHEGEVGRSAEALGNGFFTIATDLYALEVVLEPSADALKRIIPGMPATVLVLDLESAAFQGTVNEVKDNLVTVEFGSSNPGVKPGMVADVRFKVQ